MPGLWGDITEMRSHLKKKKKKRKTGSIALVFAGHQLKRDTCLLTFFFLNPKTQNLNWLPLASLTLYWEKVSELEN